MRPEMEVDGDGQLYSEGQRRRKYLCHAVDGFKPCQLADAKRRRLSVSPIAKSREA